MNRTALITGANRGIGLAIAKGLASQSLTVLMGCRDFEAGRKLAETIGENVKAVNLDLSDREVLARQLESIRSEYPQIDVLVNNAGILESGSILEISNESFQMSMRVNFEAAFDLIRLFVPDMVKHGYGRIVNVSSGWGSFADGLNGPAAYSVSKAALNALTLSLSQSLPKNVKVNAMCPGWVRTRMGGESASRSPEEGAQTAIWLATLEENGPSGGFFRDKQKIQW